MKESWQNFYKKQTGGVKYGMFKNSISDAIDQLLAEGYLIE